MKAAFYLLAMTTAVIAIAAAAYSWGRSVERYKREAERTQKSHVARCANECRALLSASLAANCRRAADGSRVLSDARAAEVERRAARLRQDLKVDYTKM